MKSYTILLFFVVSKIKKRNYINTTRIAIYAVFHKSKVGISLFIIISQFAIMSFRCKVHLVVR